MPSRDIALGSSNLSPEILRVLGAYHDRRTGAWAPGVQQATHATPDMPVGELGGVGPPVWDVVSGDLRAGWRLLVLHGALRQSSQESSGLVPEIRIAGTIWFLLDSVG